MCPGCYRTGFDTYCPSCRKLLFDGKKVTHFLSFDQPTGENISTFQEKTKRLSISGVQLKYSLRLEGTQLVLTDKGGEYILKPMPPKVELENADQVPENEHLTMQMASQVFNIETAPNALIYFKDGSPAYITKRFDVGESGKKIPQEDMAQLSGRSKETTGVQFKYEGTYEEVGKLIDKYTQAAIPAKEDFFRILVYNYLISNGDAHLKNFSLVLSEMGDYRLSKAYDILSTVIHTPNESDTALSLFEGDMNDEFYNIFGCYGQREFYTLGIKLGILSSRVERILTQMLSKSNKIYAMIDKSFLSGEIKSKYKEEYQKKLKLMGMTKTMISNLVFKPVEKAKTITPAIFQVNFIRGPQKTGRFIVTGETIELFNDNKFMFVETSQEIFKPGAPEQPEVIDGAMIVSIDYANEGP